MKILKQEHCITVISPGRRNFMYISTHIYIETNLCVIIGITIHKELFFEGFYFQLCTTRVSAGGDRHPS